MSGISANCPSTAPPPAERPARLRAGFDRVCRYMLAVAFLMAALTKVTDQRKFEDRVVLHAPVPAEAALAVARFLPWLELTCAGCLLFGRAVREAALVVVLLLLSFVIYGLLAPAGADCGCLLFPGSEQLTAPWWGTVRNLLLLLCGIRLVWRR